MKNSSLYIMPKLIKPTCKKMLTSEDALLGKKKMVKAKGNKFAPIVTGAKATAERTVIGKTRPTRVTKGR